MMRRLSLAAVFILTLSVRADEETIPLDKVPKAVLAAVKKRFPKAEIVEASKDVTEDKKTIYEIEVKEGSKTTTATLTPEGVLVQIEMEIEFKDLPKAVREMLDKKYPKADIEDVEAIYKVKNGKETLDHYAVHLTTADKKELDIEIGADGKIRKVE